jgi:RHS repeat-associated protein
MRNQVKSHDDGWGNVARAYQSHSGAVDDGLCGTDTPYVGYAYADGTIVGVAHPAVTGGLNLTYGSPSDSGGGYAGLDPASYTTLRRAGRFGRVIDQKWQDACGTPVDEYTYTYDAAGNRTSRGNAKCSSLSETYAYDGLNRLIGTDRGGDDYQRWGLDQLGNWSTFATDTNDDGVIDGSDTPQTRTHDAANQITAIDQCSAGLSYDDAGNMTGDGTLTYKYDLPTCPRAVGQAGAWPIRVPGPRENRLTEADLGESVVAVYTYDGANRRVSKAVAARDACGTLTGYDRTDYQYDEAWTSASSVEPQVLEERFAGNQCSADTVATAPHAQYVWDIRYIDAPVLRLRDTAGPSCGQPDGDLGDAGDEVLYYTNDANMNVTALVNTSGEVVERYAYDAYGTPMVLNGEEGADPDTDSQANPAVLEWSADPDGKSDVGNEILNSGYRYNYETGNSQVRNREYLTVLGRWAQPDPEGYVDGMNRASYCQDAPTTTLDPLGLKNKNFLKCASSTWRNGARVDLMWHEDIYAC